MDPQINQQMVQNDTNNKKWFWIFLVILICIGFYFGYKYYQKKNIPKNFINKNAIVSDAPRDILLAVLPKGFPLDSTFQVVLSSSTPERPTENESFNSNVDFIAQRSIEETFYLYYNYLKSDKWTIISPQNPNRWTKKEIKAVRGKEEMTITVSPAPVQIVEGNIGQAFFNRSLVSVIYTKK